MRRKKSFQLNRLRADVDALDEGWAERVEYLCDRVEKAEKNAARYKILAHHRGLKVHHQKYYFDRMARIHTATYKRVERIMNESDGIFNRPEEDAE